MTVPQNVLWVKQEAQELLDDMEKSNEALHKAHGLLADLEDYQHIVKQIFEEIGKNNRWIGRLRNIIDGEAAIITEGCQ